MSRPKRFRRKTSAGHYLSLFLKIKGSIYSVKELNELLEKKTIDFETGGPLPYKACHKCGSYQLKGGSYDDGKDLYYIIECADCGWSDWTQG